MDYKGETRRAYNEYTKQFKKKFEENFEAAVKKDADEFIRLLPGKKVLDLGSGPGIHARYFASRGLDVLCVDISEKMVASCRHNGLRAQVMDIEELDLAPASFDGVWTAASLLHVPKKNCPKS